MSEVPPRNALNLWKNGPVALALEGTDGQARMLGENNPLPVTVVGGETVTQTYAPQILRIGNEQTLTVPSGANRALVRVVTGSARMGLGSATTAPEVTPGGGLEISGAQLAALRVDVISGQVRVDYWRVS